MGGCHNGADKGAGITIAVQTGRNEVEYVEYHGRKAVIEYVKQLYRLEGKEDTSIFSYHHIEAPKMDGTEVEVHFRAAHVYSPFYICEPNEKEGKKLLAEIMNSGNFGHYDREKPNVYQHRLQYHIWKFKRILRLAKSYPEEAMWEPVFRGWRKMMKLINDY